MAEQPVVIDPIDADIREAERVGRKDRPQPPEVIDPRFLGRPQFEHHDRDDDGENAVRECLHPADAGLALAFVLAVAHCASNPALIVRSTRSDTSGMPWLIPKSLRLMLVVAANPNAIFLSPQ